MRLRADRLASFRTEKGCPVLYAEPGKHALLPDPALFCLHEEFPACCREKAGGGVPVDMGLAAQNKFFLIVHGMLSFILSFYRPVRTCFHIKIHGH